MPRYDSGIIASGADPKGAVGSKLKGQTLGG